MSSVHVAQLDAILASVSNFFDTGTDVQGKNYCPKHRVEHTGKTAYSIGIDQYLYTQTGERKYLERAKARALRMPQLLQSYNGEYFFTSDGSERWNMSNHIIDSGAVSDMLALMLEKHADEFLDKEQALLHDVLTKNCETYLTRTVLEKVHTNQRLWGATGLASGYALNPQEGWKAAISKCIEMSLNDIQSDGSIPYVTDYKKHGLDPAIADTTNYYHSRHIAFLWHAAERSDLMCENLIARLKPAVDFLTAFYQKDGIKNIQLETKRWYFISDYEIASNSYDIYAFLKFYTYTKDKRYARYALKALEILNQHLVLKQGGIRDHLGGPENFQCPYFWNSHCVWLTRISAELKLLPEDISPEVPEGINLFSNADILNVTRDSYGLIIRGAKKPQNPLWGPRIGGGSVVYFGKNDENYKNKIVITELAASIPLNFSIKKIKSIGTSPVDISKNDFKRLLFYILIEIRGGYLYSSLYRFLILLRHAFSLHHVYSSAYFCESSIKQHVDNAYAYNGGVSEKSGTSMAGVSVNRNYKCLPDSIEVSEVFRSDQTQGVVRYFLPEWTKDVTITSNGIYTHGKKAITFKKITECSITFKLKS